MAICQLLPLLFVAVLFIEPIQSVNVINKSPSDDTAFEPNWASLDRRKLPQWYDQVKVGIFIHWGVYSVPPFGSEWFWTNWRTEHAPQYIEFMKRNYRPGFTYQEFANDFRGELFNATEWAAIIQHSGARYVVLTSKHHDGYALWPSAYSFGWNSMDVGLHRDVVGELAAAIRALPSHRVHFGLYHSLYEWFNPMYVSDRSGNFTEQLFVANKVLCYLVSAFLSEIN